MVTWRTRAFHGILAIEWLGDVAIGVVRSHRLRKNVVGRYETRL
jgi:hypothetical protein